MHMHNLQQFFLTNPDNFFLTFSYIGFPQTSVRAYLTTVCILRVRSLNGRLTCSICGETPSNRIP